MALVAIFGPMATAFILPFSGFNTSDGIAVIAFGVLYSLPVVQWVRQARARKRFKKQESEKSDS